ncbi:hypothetical protein BSL84_30020 [Streptomyces sp. TN58]|nr:hypothetical protein BSL84_30020 [Streptomyces sp. TN58]
MLPTLALSQSRPSRTISSGPTVGEFVNLHDASGFQKVTVSADIGGRADGAGIEELRNEHHRIIDPAPAQHGLLTPEENASVKSLRRCSASAVDDGSSAVCTSGEKT